MSDKIKFYERLRELRRESKLTQNEIADILNVKRATISAYEKNIIVPPYEKILLLAKYFEVSVDYLTGTSEFKAEETKDIDVSDSLRMLISQIESSDGRLTIDGVELSDESKEILLDSMKNSLKLGKMLSKKMD